MGMNHRREFLKKSLAGICGAILIPGTWKTSFADSAGMDAAPSPAIRPLRFVINPEVLESPNLRYLLQR